MEASDTLDPASMTPAPRNGQATHATRAVAAFAFDAVVFLVLMVVFSAVGVAATRGSPDLPGLLATVAVATGGAALIVYRWRRRATPDERAASLAAARRPATWRAVAFVAGGVFAAANAAQWLVGQAGVEVVPTNLPLIEQALALHPAIVVLFAAVLAPAYEELLFRRVLFGRLLDAGRPWLGLVLSSAVFALMHELPYSGNPIEATLLLWAVYGGMGAAFAWLYWRTGTLLAPIVAHGLHNLASIAFLMGGNA